VPVNVMPYPSKIFSLVYPFEVKHIYMKIYSSIDEVPLDGIKVTTLRVHFNPISKENIRVTICSFLPPRVVSFHLNLGTVKQPTA
jgi:hypothetical protein